MSWPHRRRSGSRYPILRVADLRADLQRLVLAPHDAEVAGLSAVLAG
jgi:hypothetical protein